MNETIRKIIEAAIRAPSGENAQPWKFKVDNNCIDVYNLAERDTSLYNFNQRGSYIAHGALLENILIASSQFGYRTNFSLFPDKLNKQHIAHIELTSSQPKEEPLYPYIHKRSTNRKPYEITPLTHEQKSELLNTTSEVGEGEIRFVEEREQIEALAKALGTNERLVFENPQLHEFLFTHINWDSSEDWAKRTGFYIKTLELPPQAEKGFPIFKKWAILRILNKVAKVSKKAAEENAKAYSASGALGVVLVQGTGPNDYIRGGRLLERMWLKATQMGLSIQPVTGVAFLGQRIEAGEARGFSAEQNDLITQAYEEVKTAFRVENETIAMVFRIGKAESPTARSTRISLPDLLEEETMRVTDRNAQIDLVLKDLVSLKNESTFQNQYAVEENLLFFNAIRSRSSYLKWWLSKGRKIDGTHLLEINDLPTEHLLKWDRELHTSLVQLQRKDRPGLIKPLVARLTEFIEQANKPLVIANFGSGGMETVRQVINGLFPNRAQHSIIFIGFDKSSIAHDVAEENLRDVRDVIDVHRVGNVDTAYLERVKSTAKNQYVVILAQNDLFHLNKQFPRDSFDIVFHSLFKHHLTSEEKVHLDEISKMIASYIIEFDGYRSWPLMIPQAFADWYSPVLVNGAIFSNLRYPTKEELKGNTKEQNVTFSKIGTYMAEYSQ